MTTSSNHNEFQHLGEPEFAFIFGHLVDVAPIQGTAVLEAYVDSRIPLRFDRSFQEEMLRLENKFVLVKGRGWISAEDRWIAIIIEEIDAPPPSRTAEEILNDPNPKIFDPNTIPRATQPFDVDEFLRVIYEGRGRIWNGRLNG